MADTYLDSLRTGQTWNAEVSLIKDEMGLNNALAGLENIFVLEDGRSGQSKHQLKPVVGGGPVEERSDEFGEVATGRPRALDAADVSYTQYRKKLVFSRGEWDRFFEPDASGGLLMNDLGRQQIREAFKYPQAKVLAKATQVLANANNTTYLSVPAADGASSAEALAANAHTTQTASTWDNLGSVAMSQTNVKTITKAFFEEIDPWGEYSHPMPKVLFGGDPNLIHEIITSTYGSSALQISPNQGMVGVALPGMSTMWGVSSGPRVGGLTIGFAYDEGRPFVGAPVYDSVKGVYEVPYGCKFAVLCATWMGLYFSKP